ncbi:MAG: redoxin domain-containing protein [Gemmatimonadota bacterium]
MTLPATGTPAPDFTLPSTAGRPVTLSSLRGRNVLLAFFPAVFTRVCDAELCSFRDDFTEFARADTAVVPISTDATERQQEFKSAERLPMDLLSDADGTVSREYGVFDPKRGRSNRAYVLIDGAGIVRWAHVEEHGGFRRENAELLAEIARLS